MTTDSPPHGSATGEDRTNSAQEGQVDFGSLRGLLESMGALIGIMTVLLPLEGVTIRWASFFDVGHSLLPFWSAGFQVPSANLVVAASVPELAATGLAGIFVPAVFFYAGVTWALVVTNPKWIRRHTLVRRSAIGLLLVGVPIVLSLRFSDLPKWLQGSDWVVQALAFEVGAIGYLLVRNSKPSLALAVSFAVVVAFLLAFVAGFSGNPADVRPFDYRFQAQAQTHLSDGRYVALGRADGVTYLQSCQDKSVHAVPDSQIVDAQFDEQATSLVQPSGWEIVTEGKAPVLGYRPDC
jgi:hypothetical protein